MDNRLFSQLAQWAQVQPESPALQDEQGSVCWGELLTEVDQLATHLQHEAGDRIALLADNSRHWVLADLAAMKTGRVLVPVPLFFSDEQRANLFARAGIDTLITLHQDELRIQRIDAQATALHPGTAKITFTSGTTSAPKGVCLSIEQQLQVALSLADALGELNIQRHLCLLPLATLLENVAGVYAALLMGACIQLPSLSSLGWQGSSDLDIHRLIGALNRHCPDSLITLPQVLSGLTAASEQGQAIPPLKFMAVGGARVGSSLMYRAHAQKLPAYEGYGLSECASVVSLNTPRHNRIGSAGRALPHNQLRVNDAGELIIEGNLMLGYLGEPAHAGSYATGDLARIDGQGYLHVDGRSRNVIINSYGRNLSPEWVESGLLAIPGVEEAVLFGDDRPHNAALIYAPGQADAELQQQIDRLNAELPDYARVGRWARIAEPLRHTDQFYTRNGRPRRSAIAEHFANTLGALYASEFC